MMGQRLTDREKKIIARRYLKVYYENVEKKRNLLLHIQQLGAKYETNPKYKRFYVYRPSQQLKERGVSMNVCQKADEMFGRYLQQEIIPDVEDFCVVTKTETAYIFEFRGPHIQTDLSKWTMYTIPLYLRAYEDGVPFSMEDGPFTTMAQYERAMKEYMLPEAEKWLQTSDLRRIERFLVQKEDFFSNTASQIEQKRDEICEKVMDKSGDLLEEETIDRIEDIQTLDDLCALTFDATFQQGYYYLCDKLTSQLKETLFAITEKMEENDLSLDWLHEKIVCDSIYGECISLLYLEQGEDIYDIIQRWKEILFKNCDDRTLATNTLESMDFDLKACEKLFTSF